jgi:hypothetical protein
MDSIRFRRGGMLNAGQSYPHPDPLPKGEGISKMLSSPRLGVGKGKSVLSVGDEKGAVHLRRIPDQVLNGENC